MKDSDERTVSDILSEMTQDKAKAVSLMCEYASRRLKNKTQEVIQAAELIRNHMTDEEQTVAYYLIGKADSDHKIPFILTLFL